MAKKERKNGYVTRTQAVRYLQVSLADFRRLCILKGVYPRDLSGRARRRLLHGSTKQPTAYYRKDIQYLAHEPLLDTFRQHKIFAKKLSRAIGRGDIGDAFRIDANRPRYTLDHIIRERYPTFVDAVGDLDDALSMLFLFAQMPASDKISHRITEEAQRLSTEWMAYVAREHLLRKVFVSIKGTYYMAVVRGQEVVWVVPHKFVHQVPDSIDFRVMLTFLEFYTTLVHFVLYKLYTDANLVYPPPINSRREKGVGGIGTYVLASPTALAAKPAPSKGNRSKRNQKTKEIEIERARKADLNNTEADKDAEMDLEVSDEELDEFSPQLEGADVLLQPSRKSGDLLFSGLTFFVGREVPIDMIEFVGLAFGARVISEAAIDELVDNENPKESNDISRVMPDLSMVTHRICDRPIKPEPGVPYVQPQWVFDSVNAAKLLPTGPYAPGETLPPHLSPWGDRGTYVPQGALPKAAKAEAEADTDEKEADAEKESDSEEADEEMADGEETKEDDVKELRKTMMTGKQRRLYEKLQGVRDKQEKRRKRLQKKSK